jgi:hypothetical protein
MYTCRKCVYACEKRYKQTPEGKEKVWQKSLWIKYRIRVEDYWRILGEQGGRCAICGADEAGGKHNRWHVDHNHRTGQVRGLLCHSCNIGIGHLRENPDVLRSAIDYLDRWTS